MKRIRCSMKTVRSASFLLFGLMIPSLCWAGPVSPPTLATPANGAVGVNMATINLQADSAGTGYFTLLTGSGTSCGSGAQVKAGQTSAGVSAPYHGSLHLTANSPGAYTVRNLKQSSAYTICFTADNGATLQATPASAPLTTTATANQTGYTWGRLGSAGFASPSHGPNSSLAFAPDGAPYVSFKNYSGQGGRATVMKYDGVSWGNVGDANFSAARAVTTSLAFAPDGTPHVAYQDGGNSRKATVMKFDGTLWTTVGNPGFSAGSAGYTTLAFSPDGAPYVAYQDGGNNSKATLMKFDGTSWIAVGSPGFSNSAAYTSLAFTPDGTPCVAYQDRGNNSKVTVMKFDGASWIAVGSVGFSAGEAQNISLAFAPDGTPCVAYKDLGNSGKVTVMQFTGLSWTAVGGAGFSAGEAADISLAIAPDGTPCVAYSDGGNNFKATVMQFNGLSWTTVGNSGFSADNVGITLLAFAPDGAPTVAFMGNGETVMQFAAPGSFDYPLTVIAGTGGTVMPVGKKYAAATMPAIIATANRGYYFSGWSLDSGDGLIFNPNSPATQVFMGYGPATVSASFLPNTTMLSATLNNFNTGTTGGVRYWGISLYNTSSNTTAYAVLVDNVAISGNGRCKPTVTVTGGSVSDTIGPHGYWNNNMAVDFTGCAKLAMFNVDLSYSYTVNSVRYAGKKSYAGFSQ